jgi:hypothetical protein
MSPDPRIEPVAVDVAAMVERSVASLHSYLVTRPTGQAVRMAIEGQFPAGGRAALSVVDLSRVVVLDFSCADEVVAKLVLRYLPHPRPREAYFLFRGIGESHREPIQVVLERRGLAAVAQDERGQVGLLGVRSAEEERIWRAVEEAGRILPAHADAVFRGEADRRLVDRLVERRLVLRSERGGVHALSTLAAALGAGGRP